MKAILIWIIRLISFPFLLIAITFLIPSELDDLLDNEPPDEAENH